MATDLMIDIEEKTILIDKAIKQLGIRGRARAEAEYNYRIALRKRILLERDNGTPVTIISDICRGDKEIAKLRMERDIADTMYDAAKEAINGYKLQLRILNDQMEREWHSG